MSKRIKILLVEPRNEEILTGSAGTPPLWPCVLAALTPDRHELEFIQCTFEQITDDKLAAYDLVGVSSRTDTASHAYQIGDACKRLGVKCVLGGIHPFVCTAEAAMHCDSIVLGEAETLWPTVVDDACRGALEPIYRGARPTPQQLSSPDFSVVGKYEYPIENIIETVRGCPFNCSFCSATLYNGKRYRYKPVDRVLAEIDGWKNRTKLALFADLNIVSNKRKAKRLLRELAGFDLMWWGSASVDVADDDELLRLLADSGCSYLGLGFESVSPATLKEMNKKHNLRYDFKQVIARLHDHNIDVFGNFIFGLDSDTPDVFEQTIEFVLDAGIDFPVFEVLAPYPGTVLHDRLDEEGRLLTRDWSRYTRSDVVFRPKNMTVDQLVEGMFWAYETAYSKKALAGRFLSRWRGIKRSLYNAKILSHFARQVENVRQHHGRSRPSEDRVYSPS
jgi:radical SAM superfamily enzyme YgiQ (UPF0313 family)